jgi:environmental stress-induced protein Ves
MARIKQREADVEDRKAQREHEWRMQEAEAELRWAELSQRDGISREDARLRYGTQLKLKAAEIAAAERTQEVENQRFNAELAVKTTHGSGI